MSRADTAPAASVRSRPGTAAVIPWAGEHPEDGADTAFMTACSLGDGIEGASGAEAAVPAAAEENGLPMGGIILDVEQAERTGIRVLAEGGKAVLTRPYLRATCPVPDEWTSAARLRGAVCVMFAGRPWPGAAPGRSVSEDALRAFVGDQDVLTTAAHFLVPVGAIRA